MRLKDLVCPYCGGTLDMEVADDAAFVFCPYCGKKFFLDDEKKEYTYTENINISKDIEVRKYSHKRHTDDAAVIRATADLVRANDEVRKETREFKQTIILMAIFFIIPALIVGGIFLSRAINESQGKVSAGDYNELIGKDYKTVEAHFKAAGFTNVELIELNDSGLAFWKKGKVETISIGRDTTFESTDYFEPDIKVIISYH